MTIRRLTELFYDQRRDRVLDVPKVTALVNTLETKLCREIFLTHESPPRAVFAFMGALPGGCGACASSPSRASSGACGPCGACGAREPYTDEWDDGYEDAELLVKAPYDGIYAAYIRWRADAAQNDVANEANSRRAFEAAWEDFARYWNERHMPLERAPYRGYKE